MPLKPAFGVKVMAPVVALTVVLPLGEGVVTVTEPGLIVPPTWVSLVSTAVVTGVVAGVLAVSLTASMLGAATVRVAVAVSQLFDWPVWQIV